MGISFSPLTPIDVTINGNERGDFMAYVIISETETGMEVRHDIKGTPSLEKFTDPRILRIYRKAKRIYKLYGNNTVIILKGETC